MNKNVFILMCIALSLIGCNNNETVTSYLKMEYSLPVVRDYDGSYSDPKFESHIVKFDNDSIAYSKTYNDCISMHDKLVNGMAKLTPTLTDDMSEVEKNVEIKKCQIQLDVYNQLLNTHTVLLKFTHSKDLDTKQLVNDIKRIGFDKNKIDGYMKQNNISFKWIDVY